MPIKPSSPIGSPDHLILPDVNQNKRFNKSNNNTLSVDFGKIMARSNIIISPVKNPQKKEVNKLKNNLKIKINISPGSSPVKNSAKTNEENFISKGRITNVCFRSQPGKNDQGQVKTNQDNYIVIERLFDIDCYNIFGVLDGHGNIT
jgi:hypothetical protein